MKFRLGSIEAFLRTYDPPKRDIRSYDILMQPKKCGPKTSLILGIKSLGYNADRRLQIRLGWGAEKYYKTYPVKRVFLFGKGKARV